MFSWFCTNGTAHRSCWSSPIAIRREEERRDKEDEWDDEWDEFTYEITIAGGVFYEDTRDKTLDGETPHEGLGDTKGKKVKVEETKDEQK